MEMIQEVTSSKEGEASDHFVPLPEPQQASIPEGHVFFESIPEGDEQLAQDMWGAVHKHAEENWSDDNASPPFSEMDLDHPNEIHPRNSQSCKLSEPSDFRAVH